MRKFFFLLLLLTVFLPSYSIDTHWDLEPQIIKNGVGNNTIYHVCYGSEGFMWFSTVRFDRPLKLKEIQDFCWNDGNLYLATSQGLFELRPIRKKEGKDDFVYCILNPEPLIKGKITNLFY